MNKEMYRKHLVGAVKAHIEAEQILFTSSLNVAIYPWSGDLSHLEDGYEERDEMTFDLPLLKSVEDLNVRSADSHKGSGRIFSNRQPINR